MLADVQGKLSAATVSEISASALGSRLVRLINWFYWCKLF
jgi:hypothetical protein